MTKMKQFKYVFVYTVIYLQVLHSSEKREQENLNTIYDPKSPVTKAKQTPRIS